jgi:O-antigen ligase/Flp pilus assembly protein TadD
VTLGATRWIRQRAAIELMALAAGLAVFGYLGWDSALWDARMQLLLHLAAVGTVIGFGFLAVRGEELPRTAIDTPMTALLAAFALATMLAFNVGMSLRAMAAVVATAAMLPVALMALRHRPQWTGMVVIMPILGLAAGTLGALLGRRLSWVLSGAPGLPPIRMIAEGTPFGSVAVPPFILLAAWALAATLDPSLRRAVRRITIVLGVPLAILSGSRSAWLAIGTTALLLIVPELWRNRGRPRLTPRRLIVAAAGATAIVLTGALLWTRLTALSSLIYRGALWRDTLAAWSSDPLTGIGPGFMPIARQAAAADLSFPVSQPHSHNIMLGILGDTGLIGLACAAVLVAWFGWSAGPWRSRTPAGRQAAAVLFGMGAAGLFEDLTFLPGFNLLVLLLAAVALADAGAVSWVRRPRLPRLAIPAGIGAAAALVLAMVVSDAGSIAYRSGLDAAENHDWPSATRAFERSVAIDRWHPAGPDALGVARASAADLAGSRQALEQVVILNPGNGRAWANLAVACTVLKDDRCRERAARHAYLNASSGDQALANAALVLDDLGLAAEADAAYRRSLLTNPLTAFALDWPRPIELGSGLIDPASGPAPELHLLLARAAVGQWVDPADYEVAAVRALAQAMRGQRAEAEASLLEARTSDPASLLTWEVDLVVSRHWGLSTARAERIYGVLRGRPLNQPSQEIIVPDLTFDIGIFRAYPRDGFVEMAADLRVFPLYPWVLGRLLP